MQKLNNNEYEIKPALTFTKDFEVYFVDSYLKKEILTEEVEQFCIEQIKKSTIIPSNDLLKNYEIFTKPDFIDKTFERNIILFFNASIAFARYLNALVNSSFSEPKLNEYISHLEGKSPFFESIKCVFRLLVPNNTPISTIFSKDIIQFFIKNLFTQTMLVQSRTFGIFTNIIIKSYILPVFSIIKTNKSSNDFNNLENLDYFCDFLQFLTDLSFLNPNYDFFETFLTNDQFLRYNFEISSPKKFCKISDFFSSLIKTKSTCIKVIDFINYLNSDLFNFNRLGRIYLSFFLQYVVVCT